ncbi:MAG TPA: TIGR03000 domain-containing protein [Gemmataceae bacterium]|nr:TIGR03000 domain-containing protein [Gemmataceae bacterium]
MQTFIRRGILALGMTLLALTGGVAQAQGYFGEYSPGSPAGGGRGYSGGRSFFARPAYGSAGGMPFVPRPTYSVTAPAMVQDVADIHRVRLTMAVKPDAEIWFDEMRTAQAGTLRTFISPPLQPGAEYTYRIRVRWLDQGHPLSSTRKVVVHAGDDIRLTFPESAHAEAH